MRLDAPSTLPPFGFSDKNFVDISHFLIIAILWFHLTFLDLITLTSLIKGTNYEVPHVLWLKFKNNKTEKYNPPYLPPVGAPPVQHGAVLATVLFTYGGWRTNVARRTARLTRTGSRFRNSIPLWCDVIIAIHLGFRQQWGSRSCLYFTTGTGSK